MASSAPCDLCGVRPTQLLITQTDTGDTVGICPICVLPWAKELDKALKALERAANAAQGAAEGAQEGTDPPDVDTRPRRAPKASKRLQVVNGPDEAETPETSEASDDRE